MSASLNPSYFHSTTSSRPLYSPSMQSKLPLLAPSNLSTTCQEAERRGSGERVMGRGRENHLDARSNNTTRWIRGSAPRLTIAGEAE